jgi:hypothetical protein
MTRKVAEMRFVIVAVALSWIGVVSAWGQPTEMYDCLGPSSTACFDTAGILVKESCGSQYYVHRGVVSWPSLLNVGPVTISVNTYLDPQWSQFPVYIEVYAALPDTCDTVSWGFLVLTARGSDQCGGMWESIGPLDLTRLFIPIGMHYRIRAISYVLFWPAPPYPSRWMSSGLSCIRVTSEAVQQPVSQLPWGHLKQLYR